jgi:hypothetical protein
VSFSFLLSAQPLSSPLHQQNWPPPKCPSPIVLACSIASPLCIARTCSLCLWPPESATCLHSSPPPSRAPLRVPRRGQAAPEHLSLFYLLFWLCLDAIVLVGSSFSLLHCRTRQDTASSSNSHRRRHPPRWQPHLLHLRLNRVV